MKTGVQGWALEEEARRGAERTRGGSRATTGVTRQPAGNKRPMGGEAFVKVGVKDGHLRRRRDEVLKGQEAAAARQRG